MRNILQGALGAAVLAGVMLASGATAIAADDKSSDKDVCYSAKDIGAQIQYHPWVKPEDPGYTAADKDGQQQYHPWEKVCK